MDCSQHGNFTTSMATRLQFAQRSFSGTSCGTMVLTPVSTRREGSRELVEMAYLASSINSGSSVVLVAMMDGDAAAMRSASGSCDRGCGGRCLERADDAQSMSAVGLEHGRARGDDG